MTAFVSLPLLSDSLSLLHLTPTTTTPSLSSLISNSLPKP
ncbi:hypothetical protein CsSME_00040209 [Camellia sinensis var. sinensis]